MSEAAPEEVLQGKPSVDPVIAMAVDVDLTVVIKTADGKTYHIATSEQTEARLSKLEGGEA